MTSIESIRSLCITALMTAVIAILTMVPHIPIPLGYAHLGDAAIFLIVLFVGRKEGAVSASIGSAVADFLGGFPIWVVPTLLIKFGMAEILWRIAGKQAKLFTLRTFIGMFLSAAWMIVGYTLAGALLYGNLTVGLTSTPGLALEGSVNLLAAYAAGIMMDRSGCFNLFSK